MCIRDSTYIVPEALSAVVRPGVRVTVPFGTGNRTRVGMVLAVSSGEMCIRDSTGTAGRDCLERCRNLAEKI